MAFKRAAALVPLSRQHHQGLLMVLLLKKGIKRGASPAIMAAFILQNWNEIWEAHFRAEEAFLPASHPDTQLVQYYQRMQTQHVQIKNLVVEIRNKVHSTDLISAWAESFERHIRFEEREYFPYLQNALTATALNELGQHLSQTDDAVCIRYADKFWE